MRSVARLFYIRSLSSSLARVPACTAVPVLISQQSRFCSESDSERFSTKRFNTDDDQSGSSPNRLFLEQIQGVPRNLSLVPMLRSWIKAGNQLGPVEMKLVFGKLDWRYKFSQALKVYNMLEEGIASLKMSLGTFGTFVLKMNCNHDPWV
ncbi:hypothetical protein L7F22_005855 [Adiantum nelumboides]|nr:hypothetical protein [Adiantum nelumboides]